MNREYIDCNLCHTDDTRVLFEGHDRLHHLPGVFTVVQCQQCGLVYLNPRPAKDEIQVYYPDNYEPHVFFERIRHNRLARLDYNYGLNKKRRALEKFVQPGRLLDIGCGNGSFLHYMRAHNWRVCGVEISQAAGDYARQELGLEVHIGDLPDIALPPQSFDLITMWNVFEHLYDPTATLAEIKRILKPKGLLVIAVPNLASWDAQVFGAAWVGYDVPRHLYTFSPVTLDKLLHQAGFQVMESRCLFGSYQAVVHSLCFFLDGQGFGQPVQNLLKQITEWLPLRLMSAPVLRFWDSLGKGSILTVLCQIN